MHPKPTLSVHVLTYNCEMYIESTLQSIIKQKTNFKFEIVIGDDHSTDNTFKILKSYSRQHPNLINCKQNKEQLGILKNYKTTLDQCQGDYVFDIAGDDMLKSDYALQKMVNVLKNNNSLGFVDSGYDHYYEKTKKHLPFINKKTIVSNESFYKNQLLLGKIIPMGICYNKKALYDYVDFDTYLKMGITVEDYPILVDLAMHTNFDRINESLHIYRIHNKSHSHISDFEKQIFLKKQMLELISFFQKKYNLPETLLLNAKKEFYIGCLYLAGYFGKKKLGKKMYLKLNKPSNLKLKVHYLCSQFKLFRKIISPFRKL
ncbi:glycosyltransferase family 2 protein [Flavobacteriaceae bacterium XHP0103]|uniref:glycosyltransferase family 2 protein n=1 Tax=Marixanthotalea marina TaxID=2844359 RepID=UPI002989F9DE|nr:glycosyltransferase family 2 protein [Marixanthotalea marina]MBU3821172.1 glycosyltransferase family 2 protein [Marixanthotalea marina]